MEIWIHKLCLLYGRPIRLGGPAALFCWILNAVTWRRSVLSFLELGSVRLGISGIETILCLGYIVYIFLSSSQRVSYIYLFFLWPPFPSKWMENTALAVAVYKFGCCMRMVDGGRGWPLVLLLPADMVDGGWGRQKRLTPKISVLVIELFSTILQARQIYGPSRLHL